MNASLAGCSGLPAGQGASTATAQAQRAIEMATQVGGRFQQTQEAQRLAALATAQAAEDLLNQARQWPVLLSDTFENTQLDWALGEDEDPALAAIQWDLHEGAYRWQAQAVEPFAWWVTPEHEPVGDFYLAIHVQQLSGPESAEYGVIFRQNEAGEYYMLSLSETGSYAVFLFAAETWERVVDWTSTSLLEPGQAHLLEITARGADFYLTIDGMRLTRFSDDRLPSGQVGLVVGLADPGDSGAWEFDDFMLRAPGP